MALSAESCSFARGDVTQDSKLGLVSLFLTEIYSYAGGDFGSYVCNSTGKKVKGKSVKISNTYTARAKSMSAQSDSGVSASLVSAGANVALANTRVTSQAGISGGKAEADQTSEEGDIQITLTGKGKAEASFYGPKYQLDVAKLAVNFVEARLLDRQDAYIKDADVKAYDVSVHSSFNESDRQVAASAIIAGGGQGGGGAFEAG